MAYELNWDSVVPDENGKSPFADGTGVHEMPGGPEAGLLPDWMSKADAGYSDTFNKLKKEMDFVYGRYKDQLADLPKRKLALKRELKGDILKLASVTVIIPLAWYILEKIFLYLGTISGFFAALFLIVKILSFPLLIICYFFGLPPALRDLFNCAFRYRVLNISGQYDVYREKKEIISFDEEDHFLRFTIGKFERFYERIGAEGLNTVGGGEKMISLDELTPKQKETLAEMRELTVFHDVQARPGQERVSAGWKSLLLGFCILMCVFYFVLYVIGAGMSIE